MLKGSSPFPHSAQPPTATNRCRELTGLLEIISVASPWILIGHGYGGVLVGEFLNVHRNEKIAGIVTVDSPICWGIKAGQSGDLHWQEIFRTRRWGFSVIFGNESVDFGKVFQWCVEHSNGLYEGSEKLWGSGWRIWLRLMEKPKQRIWFYLV
jgi:pimeloyl-ACP methyl ester carboxylesterase